MWDAARAEQAEDYNAVLPHEVGEMSSDFDEDEEDDEDDEGDEDGEELTLPAELMQDISAAFEAIVGAAVNAPAAAAAEEEHTDIGLSTFVPAALLNQFTEELGGAIVATACAAALELLHGEGAGAGAAGDDDDDDDGDDNDGDGDGDDDASVEEGEGEGEGDE